MDRNPVYNGQIAADTSPFSFSAMVMVIVFFTSVLSYYHYNYLYVLITYGSFMKFPDLEVPLLLMGSLNNIAGFSMK